MAEISLVEALKHPIIHPWETAHEILWNNGFKNGSKVFELSVNVFKTLSCLIPQAEMPVWYNTVDTVKYTSKLLDTESLACQYATGKAFDATQADGPLKSDYIRRTVTIPLTNYSIKPLYLLKASLITTASVSQAYLIGKKYIHPELFTKIGDIFVRNIELVASSVGSQNIEFVAKVITTAGACTVKNICLIAFLFFEVYQGYHRITNAEHSEWEIYQTLKTIENAGKIALISMCLIGGAPAWAFIGTGLITSYVTITEIYQKATTPRDDRS